MERVHILSEGTQMEGTMFVPEGVGPFPGVLILPGFSSSETRFFDLAQMLRAKGIAALTLNIRGHGESEGDLYEMNARDLQRDGVPGYDYLASRPEVDGARIGISGSSFGGMVAALTSAERPVKSLLLRAPAAYSEAMLDTPFKDLAPREKEVFFEIPDPAATQAVKAIEKFTGSLLIIASGKDDVIPLAIPEAYFDHMKSGGHKEIDIMEGAPHSLSSVPAMKAQFNERALTWFSQTL